MTVIQLQSERAHDARAFGTTSDTATNSQVIKDLDIVVRLNQEGSTMKFELECMGTVDLDRMGGPLLVPQRLKLGLTDFTMRKIVNSIAMSVAHEMLLHSALATAFAPNGGVRSSP